MIKREVYEKAIFETVKKGATVISSDVEDAFIRAIEKETKEGAKDGLIKGSKVMSSSVYVMDALVANGLITETIEGDTRVVFTIRGEKADNGFEILINGTVFEGDFSLIECKDVQRIDIRHK